jgi:hypothetical protein
MSATQSRLFLDLPDRNFVDLILNIAHRYTTCQHINNTEQGLPAPTSPHHRTGKIAQILPCIFPRSLARVSHCRLHFQDFQKTCRSHQDVLSPFGSDEKSCFPVIMVEKRLLSEACNWHP